MATSPFTLANSGLASSQAVPQFDSALTQGSNNPRGTPSPLSGQLPVPQAANIGDNAGFDSAYLLARNFANFGGQNPQASAGLDDIFQNVRKSQAVRSISNAITAVNQLAAQGKFDEAETILGQAVHSGVLFGKEYLQVLVPLQQKLQEQRKAVAQSDQFLSALIPIMQNPDAPKAMKEGLGLFFEARAKNPTFSLTPDQIDKIVDRYKLSGEIVPGAGSRLTIDPITQQITGSQAIPQNLSPQTMPDATKSYLTSLGLDATKVSNEVNKARAVEKANPARIKSIDEMLALPGLPPAFKATLEDAKKGLIEGYESALGSIGSYETILRKGYQLSQTPEEKDLSTAETVKARTGLTPAGRREQLAFGIPAQTQTSQAVQPSQPSKLTQPPSRLQVPISNTAPISQGPGSYTSPAPTGKVTPFSFDVVIPNPQGGEGIQTQIMMPAATYDEALTKLKSKYPNATVLGRSSEDPLAGGVASPPLAESPSTFGIGHQIEIDKAGQVAKETQTGKAQAPSDQPQSFYAIDQTSPTAARVTEGFDRTSPNITILSPDEGAKYDEAKILIGSLDNFKTYYEHLSSIYGVEGLIKTLEQGAERWTPGQRTEFTRLNNLARTIADREFQKFKGIEKKDSSDVKQTRESLAGLFSTPKSTLATIEDLRSNILNYLVTTGNLKPDHPYSQELKGYKEKLAPPIRPQPPQVDFGIIKRVK